MNKSIEQMVGETDLQELLRGMNRSKAEQTSQLSSVDNLQNKLDYIYVPSIKLYLAKNRTHCGFNWYDSHEALQSEGLRMPTIYEFKEYINYLRQNPNGINDATSSEISAILDDILTIRDPRRSEWLDARFEKVRRKLKIHTLHKYSNKNLIYSKPEALVNYLMRDQKPGIDLVDWLTNSNREGLPKPKTKEGQLYYWYPINGYVAKFSASSVWTSLDCFNNPTNADPTLGVFACAQYVSTKIIGDKNYE